MLKRLFLSLALVVVVTGLQSLPAMSMEQWAAWLKFQAEIEPYGGISGYQAYLDDLEQAGQIGSGAGAGVSGGTLLVVGGSIVGIVMGGVTIYFDWKLYQQQSNLLQQMQNPPPQQPGQPYYNPGVPLDLFDPWIHLQNYGHYLLHPIAG
jgi:hypothetical protein